LPCGCKYWCRTTAGPDNQVVKFCLEHYRYGFSVYYSVKKNCLRYVPNGANFDKRAKKFIVQLAPCVKTSCAGPIGTLSEIIKKNNSKIAWSESDAVPAIAGGGKHAW
jgi:hypothetical protein